MCSHSQLALAQILACVAPLLQTCGMPLTIRYIHTYTHSSSTPPSLPPSLFLPPSTLPAFLISPVPSALLLIHVCCLLPPPSDYIRCGHRCGRQEDTCAQGCVEDQVREGLSRLDNRLPLSHFGLAALSKHFQMSRACHFIRCEHFRSMFQEGHWTEADKKYVCLCLSVCPCVWSCV